LGKRSATAIQARCTMSIPTSAFGGQPVRPMRSYWLLFVIEGLVLLVLGALAIVVPPIATLGITIFIGWLLLISGVVGLVMTFAARHAPGFWWSLVSGLLGVAAGLVLLVWPVSGALSLTLVLTAFFIVEGVASIMYALDHRRQLSGRWGWMLFSGIVDLVLAAIIIAGFPGTALWALGTLVGVNMIFGGASLVGIGLHARGTT
jgi:uncharacterized membrane protein HdeD (DUF308 family)